MKKFFALILAVVMAFALVACADTGKDGGSDKSKVSIFWYDASDVYLSSVRTSLNKMLDAHSDKIVYDNQDAANDQSKQIEQIRTAVAGGAKALVVNLVTTNATDTAKDIIKIAGDIPVIFFNRAIGEDGADVKLLNENANVTFIGTDAPEAGHMQGKMIGEYLVANYDKVDFNKDGKISYAMMKGDEANPEAIFRTQFAVEDANKVLKEAGKPELVYFDASNPAKYQVDLGGQWSAAAAKEYMDTNFVTYNEGSKNMIELVICNNDGMAEGVVAALQAKGYNKGDGHVVPVFGVDATSNAQALIAEGAMTGTIKQDAEGMALAVSETVVGILNGKAPVEALAAIKDDRLSISKDCKSKLFVAYSPYTGK